jgi:hypothetical protein
MFDTMGSFFPIKAFMECNTFKRIEEGGVMATVYPCIWKVPGLNIRQGYRYADRPVLWTAD